jgi:hypothetical protein
MTATLTSQAQEEFSGRLSENYIAGMGGWAVKLRYRWKLENSH